MQVGYFILYVSSRFEYFDMLLLPTRANFACSPLVCRPLQTGFCFPIEYNCSTMRCMFTSLLLEVPATRSTHTSGVVHQPSQASALTTARPKLVRRVRITSSSLWGPRRRNSMRHSMYHEASINPPIFPPTKRHWPIIHAEQKALWTSTDL